MDWILSFLTAIWNLVAEMAPYLLVGLLLSGFIHTWIRPDFIARLLGRRSWVSSAYAIALGVPLPLCSCSVIPVATTLRKSGASPAATAAFLTSTPQTGVDSILATQSLMGTVFTAYRVVVAVISGLVSGLVISLLPDRAIKDLQTVRREQSEEGNSDPAGQSPEEGRLRASLRYGLWTLPEEIGRPFMVGILIAAVLAVAIPDSIYSWLAAQPLLSYVGITLISIPVYVCATGSIPIAYGLLAAGLTPGAALIFLIAGPATNAATITTMASVIGKRAIAVYVGTVVIISWIAGFSFDRFFAHEAEALQDLSHAGMHPGLFSQICGAILLILFIAPWLRRLGRRNQGCRSSCCQN